jgi:hypothetical protein
VARLMRYAVPIFPVGRPSGKRTRRSEAAQLDAAASGKGRLAVTSPRLRQCFFALEREREWGSLLGLELALTNK